MPDASQMPASLCFPRNQLEVLGGATVAMATVPEVEFRKQLGTAEGDIITTPDPDAA